MKKLFFLFMLICLSTLCYAQRGFSSESDVYKYLIGKTFKFNSAESKCDSQMKLAFGTSTFFYKDGKFGTTLNGKRQGDITIERFYGFENNNLEANFWAYNKEQAEENASQLRMWQTLFICVYKQYNVVTIAFAGDDETLLVYKLQGSVTRNTRRK